MMRLLLTGTLFALFVGTAAADDLPSKDTASDSLLRYLGTDVGFCLEVTGGEKTIERVFSGELAERIRGTSVFKQWLAGDDYRQFESARLEVEKLLGKPVDRFAAGLLGRDVVFALFPRIGGEPEAVLLTRAASDKELSEAIAIWNRLEPGRVTTTLRHGEREYQRREHRAQVLYYVAHGSLFAVSEQEDRIHAILDRIDQSAATGVLGSERYQRARSDVSTDAAAVAYFNPRAWDDALPEPRDETGRNVRAVFDRTESIIASLRAEPGIVVETVARYDGDRSVPDWQRYVERIEGAGAFLERVPQRALYVGVGRVDVAGIAGSIYGSFPEAERKRFDPWRRFVALRFLNGLDPIDDVLPNVGPEWGAYIVPRETLVPRAAPVEGLLAVEMPAGDRDAEAVKASEAIDGLLTSGLEFWVAVHNSNAGEDTAAVRTRDENGTRVRWIEGIGPYRPAYALTPGFLVLASTPDLVPEFVEPTENDRLVDQTTFRKIRDAYFPRANQLVFLNVAEVRRFVGENREFLLAELARQRNRDPDNVAPGVLRLEEVLGLIDATFVAGHVESDRVRVVIGAVTEEPPAR